MTVRISDQGGRSGNAVVMVSENDAGSGWHAGAGAVTDGSAARFQPVFHPLEGRRRSRRAGERLPAHHDVAEKSSKVNHITIY